MIYVVVRSFNGKKWAKLKLLLTLVLAFVALPGAIVLEAGINLINSATMKTVLSSILGITVCLLLPVWLVAERPADYNPLAQVLFSILLTFFSVWCGYSLASRSATRETTGKWLPGAETAVKQLITISTSIERMRRLHRAACDAVESSVPRKTYELHCKETSEKLCSIRDMVENASSTWEVFIASNCEKIQCDDIGRRIDVVRTKLAGDLEKDFPYPSGCTDVGKSVQRAEKIAAVEG